MQEKDDNSQGKLKSAPFLLNACRRWRYCRMLQNKLLEGRFGSLHRVLSLLVLLVLIFFLTGLGKRFVITQPSSEDERLSLRREHVDLVNRLPAFDENLLQNSADHLIIVACHAVIAGSSLAGVEHDDSIWYLLDYQKNKGMPEAFVSHIKEGVKIANRDPNSLLLFSGGQTRKSAGPKSEASGYFSVADHFRWWNMLSVRERSITEDHARDSFENLLFSICRFYEIVGQYPAKISLISFSFKKDRFEHYHRSAVRYPARSFNFVGVDPPSSTGFDVNQLDYWEKKAALKPYKNDLYGCNSKLLVERRKERNPFLRSNGYASTCPQLQGLLAWCGKGVYPGKLPWS